MPIDDDPPSLPRATAPERTNLDRLGIEELEAHIALLRAEIARAEAEIARKRGLRSAADAVFRA